MKCMVLLAIAATVLSTSAIASEPGMAADRGQNFSLILESSKSARGGSSGYHRSAPAYQCCKICTVGKACGDTCISRDKICHIGPGCACDG
jgi:hypothetical protein